MTDQLPDWVWAVLIDLDEQRDTHPRLLQFTADGVVGYDWCPCRALEKVPAEVLEQARVLRDALTRHPAPATGERPV